MAKMGSRKHLKTYKAPKTWPIHPKEDTWTVKPQQLHILLRILYL